MIALFSSGVRLPTRVKGHTREAFNTFSAPSLPKLGIRRSTVRTDDYVQHCGLIGPSMYLCRPYLTVAVEGAEDPLYYLRLSHGRS